MARHKRYLLYILIIMLLFVGLYSALDQKPLEDYDTSKVMVSFNPYVSVLDRYNRSRYGIAELIPLIEKVATRFNKIHIELTSNDINFGGPKSLTESLFAVALYNCLATTTTKLEVFLDSDAKELNDFRKLVSMADKANSACDGTVSSILIRYTPANNTSLCPTTEKFRVHLNHWYNYSLGLSMSKSSFCYLISNCNHLDVDVLLLKFGVSDEHLRNFTNIICEPYSIIQNWTQPVKLITSSVASDNVTDSVVNMTSLVAVWKHTLTLPSDMYLISFAFDYYNNDDGHYTSEGWWYLVKDPGNGNTSEYIFEEKSSVASKVDFEEDPKNFQWLEQDHAFDKNSTGIVSLRENVRYAVEFELFCRLMHLNKKIRHPYEELYINSDRREGFTDTCSSFSVYHLPLLDTNGLNLYTTSSTNIIVYKTAPSNTLEIKRGYAYSLYRCYEHKHAKSDFDSFSNQINVTNIEVIIFYFYDGERSVRLGATKLARQRTVLFEKCTEMVNFARQTSIEIGFVSVGYFRVDTFYDSAIDLQNYVKYIYLLEKWAKSQTNTVMFLGQFNDEKIEFAPFSILYDKTFRNVVGWKSYYRYISKREEALETSRRHYEKPKFNVNENVKTVNLTAQKADTYTASQVFLVVGISVVLIVIVIVIVVFLMCRHYKNNIITNGELRMFFNGDKHSDNCAHKIPYDKERYEVVEKNFKIESEVRLGAGEFGAVYRGIIEQSSGNLQVAVKTSNPQKLHTTQITGLLSEIKVLAHIGKHANITELLGANTSSLKNGKIYIFLEFCHLGSLEKYLQEIRLLVSSPIQETNVDTATSENNYTNASATTKNTLDNGLSEELYRWSTEICNGMAFLAEKHVVHADLATRNVLLNLRREAKICDFGLSRRMYNYTNYVKTQQEPLPWKWMAPESLSYMEFNEKSDVWAYGVTLWEIYSLGRNPYASLSWDINFSQILEQGLRLSEPEYCERDMYEKMLRCWNICPDNRPTFSEMLIFLQSSDGEEANE